MSLAQVVPAWYSFTVWKYDLKHHSFIHSVKRDLHVKVLSLVKLFTGNHSCDPNAEVHYPHNNATLEVRTLRPIKQGEVSVTMIIIDSQCYNDV